MFFFLFLFFKSTVNNPQGAAMFAWRHKHVIDALRTSAWVLNFGPETSVETTIPESWGWAVLTSKRPHKHRALLKTTRKLCKQIFAYYIVFNKVIFPIHKDYQDRLHVQPCFVSWIVFLKKRFKKSWSRSSSSGYKVRFSQYFDLHLEW